MSEPISVAIATQAFSGLLANLASNYIRSKKRRLAVSHAELTTDLKPHFESTFNRCTVIKTILNQNNPVNFLDVYVNQSFTHKKQRLDGYDLIDFIRAGNNVVVTGTGGGGKTMFMRYLWLSYFEKSDGKIPLFLELRNTNQNTFDDIKTYLFRSLIQSKSRITEKNFVNALAGGDIILMLDGFDEILVERREWAEQQIINLASDFPKLTIIASGRPDTRFSGWQSFYNYHVDPLEQKQVIDLLEKADYDQVVKANFIKKVKSNLYKTHKSFLSNPLLACMMLISFDHYADIPEKMHLFYQQAFEALYQRHDSTKGGFTRKFRTGMTGDLFKRYLSYFCLLTYYEEKFEFSGEEAIAYIMKAFSIEGKEIDAEAFLIDLEEAVCVLQTDGLLKVFSHRSFQEYFAAYCIARVTTRNIEVFLRKFARRYSDQVIAMIYDMNPEAVKTRYVVPEAGRFEKLLGVGRSAADVARFLWGLHGVFEIRLDASPGEGALREPLIVFRQEGEFNEFCEIVRMIGRKREEFDPRWHRADRRAVEELRSQLQIGRKAPSIVVRGTEVAGFEIKVRNAHASARVDLDKWFVGTGMYAFLRARGRTVAGAVAEIKKNVTAQEKTIDELFGLASET